MSVPGSCLALDARRRCQVQPLGLAAAAGRWPNGLQKQTGKGHIWPMAKHVRKRERDYDFRLTASPARFVGTVRAPDEETARDGDRAIPDTAAATPVPLDPKGLARVLIKRSGLKRSCFEIEHPAYSEDNEKNEAKQGEFVPDHGFSPGLSPEKQKYSAGSVPSRPDG